MPDLLTILLDSWDCSNRVLVNLLRALPAGGLQARALEGSPTVAEMFSHMHHERLVSVAENAPELGVQVPAQEWATETDVEKLAAILNASAAAVRQAVQLRVATGQPFDREYAHPILLVQLLIFHEGYHHGQIKLALKA